MRWGVGRSIGLALCTGTLALVAGCASGPADIASGDYRAFAASSELGATNDVVLSVSDSTFTFTVPGGDSLTASATAGTEQFVVCPPDTTGTPLLLGPSLTLGNVTLQQPAVFGDCGQTSPKRLTVIDLASVSDGAGPFPFTRWIEFCDTSDPDC